MQTDKRHWRQYPQSRLVHSVKQTIAVYRYYNKYLYLIVDVGTGWTTGRAIIKKSDASDVILKTLELLQLAFNKKVQKLHTDGAQEQFNDKLKHFLEDKGTVKSTTAPNSSSSNAFVEHRMGIVFSAARAALKAASAPLNHQKKII